MAEFLIFLAGYSVGGVMGFIACGLFIGGEHD